MIILKERDDKGGNFTRSNNGRIEFPKLILEEDNLAKGEVEKS